jgi:hypothetical protein
MTIYRLIAPKWSNLKPSVLEGQFSDSEIQKLNAKGYNIYYLPNHPNQYDKNTTVDGTHIDVFNYVFVDIDLKDGVYESKEQFIEMLSAIDIKPSRVIDSGNGVHAYWKVSDLDAMSYLRFQRRLVRLYHTDEATCSIYQLMRMPGTLNTKLENQPVECIELYNEDISYTCEELNALLPPITLDDEKFCQNHYDKTFNINRSNIQITDVIPPKFGALLSNSKEAKELWVNSSDDRSKSDYRLGHLMFANGFTKDEAAAVLMNSAKALTRAPVHRVSYAENIIDKIWTYEQPESGQYGPKLSQSVLDILSATNTEELKGIRLKGHSYIDNTAHGFRLGQVIGLVAGVGVGKTAISMNLFQGFVQNNPEYIHLFVSLEQPAREIAERWQQLCQGDTTLHSKVHILSNYNDDGTYRNLSLAEIEAYVLEYQAQTGVKFGSVVIDHLGVLKKKNKNGENEGLIEVCQKLKSFAIVTNTLLVIQSQSNREKAGIGDLELNKDAAYGTQSFESFLDYLIVCWQPLKRKYDEPACPTVTAIKFAKIRFKNKEKDVIKEDVRYLLFFDTQTGILRPTTQYEDKAFVYYNNVCANLRKSDRKTEVVPYVSVRWGELTSESGTTDSH